MKENRQEICNKLLDLLEATDAGKKIGKLEYDNVSETIYIGNHDKDGFVENVKGMNGMDIVNLVLSDLEKFKR